MSATWTRVAAATDVAPEGALRVDVAGRAICLARSSGTLYAINDTCTHADVSLAQGDVEDGTIECWLHGSRFDLATGAPTGLPATVPVAIYPVKTEGDDIFVAVEG